MRPPWMKLLAFRKYDVTLTILLEFTLRVATPLLGVYLISGTRSTDVGIEILLVSEDFLFLEKTSNERS